MSTPSWLIRERDVSGYHPVNHTGTLNQRLISPAIVGSKHIKVLLGVIEKGQGALPHAQPGIEQVCYLLSAHTYKLPMKAAICRPVLLLFPARSATRFYRYQR